MKKIFFYPIILLLSLFLLDKIFLLESVKKYIKSDFTHIYYETREELFEQLTKDEEIQTKKKKLLIILGSSRLLYFDAKELKELYPDWKIYNLSSAVTTPAYYYYYVEKIFKANLEPNLILLETDSNQFNANSPVFKGSNLTYSFSPSFVLRHWKLFGKDNLSFYFGKYLFAVGKNKPYLDTAIKRLQDPNFETIAAMQEYTRNFLLTNQGNALSIVENYVEKDFASLQATSQRTLDWVYANYSFSDMQFQFYEMVLENIKNHKTPLIIVIPQVSIPMQELLNKMDFHHKWKEKIDILSAKYGYVVYDMSKHPDYYCNAYVDGGHIAKDCYHPFMRFVMLRYFEILK